MIAIDVLEAIKNRRSIHQFKKTEVPKDILTDIFTYASWAPTHYMKEPWNIKLYQDAGKEPFINAIIRSYQRLGMMKTDKEEKTLRSIESIKQFLLDIPHHALIYLPMEIDPIRYEEEYASVCAFIQNAQLAAWKLSVGMLWTITPYMHDPVFVHDIGLDHKKHKIAAVLQIGYPQKIPMSKKRTLINEKMEIISE